MYVYVCLCVYTYITHPHLGNTCYVKIYIHLSTNSNSWITNVTCNQSDAPMAEQQVTACNFTASRHRPAVLCYSSQQILIIVSFTLFIVVGIGTLKTEINIYCDIINTHVCDTHFVSFDISSVSLNSMPEVLFDLVIRTNCHWYEKLCNKHMWEYHFWFELQISFPQREYKTFLSKIKHTRSFKNEQNWIFF